MQLTATESRNRQQRSRQQRRQRQWRCMQREPTRPPSGDAPPRGRAGVPREGPKTGKAVASAVESIYFLSGVAISKYSAPTPS